MGDWAAFVRSRLHLTGLRETREAEIVEDVARLLDDAYREAMASGLDEAEARAAAEQHITDWDALARQLSRSPRQRTPWFDRWSSAVDDRAASAGGFSWAGRVFSDVRHGLRLMLRTPGFSFLAVIMIALGTGANAAVFSVVHGVLVESPFDRPDDIASVAIVPPAGSPTAAVPRDVLARVSAVAAAGVMAEFTTGSPVVTGVDVPRRTQVQCIEAEMVQVLGAPASMGRWFAREEDTPTGPAVVVISHAFWRTVLNSDPAVLGRRLLLDDMPVEVIGVMPRGFDGPLSRPNRDLWAPFGQLTPARPAYGCRLREDTGNALLRVHPGVAIADAESRLNAAIGPIQMKDGSGRLKLIPVLEETHGNLRPMLLALTGAVIAVLLIACANVANLGLARLVSRRREIAVRLALGATRPRIILQTVVEQLVVAAIGAAAGLLLAFLAFDALLALLPRTLPQKDLVSLNVAVLAASVGVTLLSALLVGLVPAVQCSRVSLRGGLADTQRTATAGSRTFRWALVVGELALGVVLLVGALLMIRTFLILRPDSPGFDPSNKSVALIRLPAALPADERRQFSDAAARQLLETRAARQVATTTYLPMSRVVDMAQLRIDDSDARAMSSSISANYLDVMRIPLVRGRAFQAGDSAGAEPVALVNEAFVRRWLGSREPLGAIVEMRPGQGAVEARRVVGVVGDTRFTGLDDRPRPEIYLPIAQQMTGNPYLIVSGDPADLAALPSRLREIVNRLRPGQLVDRVDRLESLLAAEVAQPRLGAWLLGLFGGIAVLLAVIGLGTTLAWSVAERRREIGVRMALGATPARIRQLVIRQTAGLASLAIVVGLTAAAFATRLIESWLYGIARHDGRTYLACAAGMLIAALVAAYVPTRRATRVDPLVTLREE